MRLQLRDLDLDAVRPYLDYPAVLRHAHRHRLRLGVPRRHRRPARLGLRRREGAGQPGDHDRRRGQGRGSAATSGLMFTGFEVRQLGRRPPHGPPHRARGDPGGAAGGDRAARRPAARTSPSDGTARHRDGEPAAEHGHRARSISTPGSTRSGSPPTWRSTRSRSTASAAPFPRSESRARCAAGSGAKARSGAWRWTPTLGGDLATSSAEGFTTLLPPLLGRGGPAAPLQPGRSRRADRARRSTARSPASCGSPAASTPCARRRGRLELALTRSRLREWTLDSVFARGASRDSMIRMDTAYAEWQGARAAGAGHARLGGAAPRARWRSPSRPTA